MTDVFPRLALNGQNAVTLGPLVLDMEAWALTWTSAELPSGLASYAPFAVGTNNATFWCARTAQEASRAVEASLREAWRAPTPFTEVLNQRTLPTVSLNESGGSDGTPGAALFPPANPGESGSATPTAPGQSDSGVVATQGPDLSEKQPSDSGGTRTWVIPVVAVLAFGAP